MWVLQPTSGTIRFLQMGWFRLTQASRQDSWLAMTIPSGLGPNAGLPPTQIYWTTQIQQQVSNSMVATIGYVGSHTYHLGTWSKPNALNPPVIQAKYGAAAAAAGVPLNDLLTLSDQRPQSGRRGHHAAVAWFRNGAWTIGDGGAGAASISAIWQYGSSPQSNCQRLLQWAADQSAKAFLSGADFPALPTPSRKRLEMPTRIVAQALARRTPSSRGRSFRIITTPRQSGLSPAPISLTSSPSATPTNYPSARASTS